MSKHVTPLRYPGGKQKLTPFILELLVANRAVGGHYVEPYAGGAGVALELLLKNHVSHIHLNDSSYPIYAFWKSVISHPEQLCRQISRASLTITEWKKRREIVRNPKAHDELDVGFSAFYLNRCNRSGVLSGGVIGGIAQTGTWKMDARFSRNELIRRIEAIALKRRAISIRNWDAERFILEYIPRLPAKTFVYCDPPYFEKSGGLYLDRYKPDDHERIARVIQKHLKRKWVVSYDDAPQILKFYGGRRAFVYRLQYSGARAYEGKEVFIFSDGLTVPCTSSLTCIDRAIDKCASLPVVPRALGRVTSVARSI
jgi:DNA adenine methylase